MALKSDFKTRLREALDKLGIKQITLSKATGINKGTINNYLSGKYKPKQDNISRICDFLNVDEAWLMGFDVPMNRSNNSYIDSIVLPQNSIIITTEDGSKLVYFANKENIILIDSIIKGIIKN